MFKPFIALTAAALAAIAPLTPAIAADARIEWKDLDLTSDTGRAELERRVETAAQTICGPQAVTGSRIARRSGASCLATARSEINAQIAKRIDQTRLAKEGSSRPAVASAR